MTVIGNYLILGNGGLSTSLTVSVDSGAVVTATNGSKTVIGTSVSGTCALALPEPGTWTVSATLNGDSSGTKTVEVEDNYSTTLFFVGSTLNNTDWDIISAVSNAGQGMNYWSVGDRKAVVLNGTVGSCTFSNATYYCFIIGFDHNSEYEGINRIHFQFGKTALTDGTDICFIDSKNTSSTTSSSTFYFSPNYSSSNGGGWKDSSIRNNICGTSLTSYSGKFIGVLPSDLRSVLKSVTKYTDNYGGGSNNASYITSITEYIFLLAEYEVFGSITNGNTYESNKQLQYAYYSAGNSKVKYRYSATGTANIWWLRSPSSGSTKNFVYVATNGTVGVGNANYSRGFAPCFCV